MSLQTTSDEQQTTGCELPVWFRQRIVANSEVDGIVSVLNEFRINTVCESACCPNRAHCYGKGTATFMILGTVCTRDCRFCAVSGGKPRPADAGEPERICLAVRKMGLKHVVITSVSRDDLPDGGAGQFAETIHELRKLNSAVTVELLIPDFQGGEEHLRTVTDAYPDVVGHNLETVPRLYPEVRPQAVYKRSVELLMRVKSMGDGVLTKSGLMLGLGETVDEVEETFENLRSVSCDILTLGQYLRPSEKHVPVVEYISPEQFQKYRKLALFYGFKAVVSAPLVRSSYNAEEVFAQVKTAQLPHL